MNRNLLNNHADVNNELQMCNAVDDRVLETDNIPGNGFNACMWFAERPAKGTESNGRNLEHHGEKREDYVDQKGSRRPEKI